MFVVFEGIDGSGKTTISNLVAGRLREAGVVVEHVREGGTFASRVTQALRELGRDSRNLALTPRAELMLYLTREVQLLEEATRPALTRADVVIADRFVSTAEVLAIWGRGLPPSDVEPLVTAAVAGLRPDLTILVDVEPRIARARRQVSKLIAAEHKPPSRKGMAGPALQRRLRDGYRALAARDDRWVVIDNTDAELEANVELVLRIVEDARKLGIAAARAQAIAAPAPALSAGDVTSARDALLAWIDRRAAREPGLAAYFLDGLMGPGFDERRLALAPTVPRVLAAGLDNMTDPLSWQLRRELAARAPDLIARSIAADVPTAEGDAMLRELAASVPLDVGAALRTRDDDAAWQLRDLLPADARVLSLGGVHAARAWPIREAWLESANVEDPRVAALACACVESIAGERAWEFRKSARPHAPVAALDSIAGLDDDRSWRWRAKYIERAPKAVIKSLGLLMDPRAWTMRMATVATCEEVMDSILGLDDPRAWDLRAGVLDLWPAPAVRSLGALASARAEALIHQALAGDPGNVALWRQVLLHAQRTASAR